MRTKEFQVMVLPGSISLFLSVPASILTPLQTIKVRIHGHVNIPCVAVGHPNPRITWTFKHKKLFRRRKRAVYSDGNLRLSDVKLKDAGPYNCSAVNSFGTDWNIITLVVQGRSG